MNSTINIGSFNIPGFVTIENDGKTDGSNCIMGGMIGEGTMVVIKKAKDAGIRCTLDEYSELGTRDPQTGNYSGMIGALYNGDIAYVAMPVYYPLRDDKNAIEMTPPFIEDTMTMISMYNVTTTQKKVDLSHMYQSIPITLWLGLLASFAIFAFLLSIGLKLFKRKPRPKYVPRIRDRTAHALITTVQRSPKLNHSARAIWIMTCAFLFQSNFPRLGPFVASLSLATSIPIFFIMCYINSNVSTDLVVVDRPVTLNSYQDVLDREDVRALFTSVLPEKEKFSEAPSGSTQWKLYNSNPQFYNSSPGAMSKIWGASVGQKAVMIGRETLGSTFALTVLTVFEERAPNLRALEIVDPEAKKYTNVFCQSKRSPPKARALFDHTIKKMQESGIVQHIYYSIPRHVIEEMMETPLTTSVRSKFSRKVEEQNHDPEPIDLANIHNMIGFYIVLMMLNTICLIIEHIHEKYVDYKTEQKMPWSLVVQTK